MHSNSVFSFVVVLVACGSFAGQPQEVFENNREFILSGECFQAGDFYFGVGIGTVKSKLLASDSFAKAKAVQVAKANLINRKAVEGFIWPDGIDKTSADILSRMVAENISVRAHVMGIDVLAVEKMDSDANSYMAVVYAPNDNLINVPSPSLEEVNKCLLNPHWLKANFHRCPQGFYKFYLSQKKLPDSLVGVEIGSWDEAQLDLFCGIPHPDPATDLIPSEDSMNSERTTVPEKGKSLAEDDDFKCNMNDTIGLGL